MASGEPALAPGPRLSTCTALVSSTPVVPHSAVFPVHYTPPLCRRRASVTCLLHPQALPGAITHTTLRATCLQVP